MTQQGYLIARNRRADAFFTSASSYDRPSWVALTEAKKYATAEMAQAAATKLYRHGAYEARIVSLQEAMAFDFPEEDMAGKKQEIPPMELPNDEEALAQQSDEGGMVAAEQQPASDGDENNGGEDDELEDLVDQASGEEPGMKPRNSSAGEELAQRLSSGEGGLDGGGLDDDREQGLGESAEMPAKPPADAQPSENDKTANKLPKTPAIKYKDPSEEENPADDESANSVILPHDQKIKIPAEVMTALNTAIAEFDKGATYAGNQNDDKASFCMTVADAFKSLKANLDFGTVAGLKSAQINMTSWMNPITSHLPEVVQKFIYMGGKKQTLQNMFDMKRPSRV